MRSVFLGPPKNYEIRFDRAADIARVVDETPIMISSKYTPLQKKKDFVKVNLRAKKSVNEQLVKKGARRSWFFYKHGYVSLLLVRFFFLLQ